MARIIDIRKNKETGEEEIIIKDINNDLEDLLEVVNQIREIENVKKKKIKSKIIIAEELDFEGIEYKKTIYIPYCEFQKSINFRGAKFHDKVRFHHCIFKDEVCFENATFYDLIDFYNATFENAQQFYRVDFKKVVVFSNTKFKGETQFLYCTTDPNNTYLNFENAEFDKYVDISRSNFNNNLNFWNVKIGENLDLSNTEYYKDSFGIHKNDTPDAHTLIRESYRRIKKSFADNGNKIAESEFAGREQKIFLKELSNDNKKEKYHLNIYVLYIFTFCNLFIIFLFSILETTPPTLIFLLFSCIIIRTIILICYDKIRNIIRYFNDFIMLWFNKYSNNFGGSWIRGVLFTILMGVITILPIIIYLIYDKKKNINPYLDLSKITNTIGIFLQNLGEILNPIKWANLSLFNTEPTGWIYVWIFIGRIFIAYGYYQTIQAFRKYGKS